MSFSNFNIRDRVTDLIDHVKQGRIVDAI